MLREVRKALADYRELLMLCVAGVGVVGYQYLTPPFGGAEISAWLGRVSGLAGDLPEEAWRFVASAALLGLLPLSVGAALGEKAAELGLAAPRRLLPGAAWALVAAGALLVPVVVAYSPPTFAYYPYSKTLVERVAERGPGPFAAHAAAYLLLYYLPWEFLFRGVLVFPLARLAPQAPRTALYAIVSLQALPSAMLHAGHPAMESLGAVAFGVGAGVLALESGSILPGLAIHGGIGLLSDLLIVLRRIGALP